MKVMHLFLPMLSYRQRQVAFRLQYEGGPYFGFASQCGECDETIEKHLFAALTKLKLVECRQVTIAISITTFLNHF